VRNERKEHPAASGVEGGIVAQGHIVGFRLVTSAEGGGGVKLEGGEIIMAVIGKKEWVIIRNLLAEEGKNEGDRKEEKSEPCALDGAEAAKAFPGKIGEHGLNELGKTDAGIEHDVEDIGEEATEHGEYTDEDDEAHDDVVIASNDGVIEEQAHAIDIEDALDKKGAGKHDGKELGAAGGQGDKGVAKAVLPDGGTEGDAFDKSGADVLLVQLIEEAVLHELSEKGEFSDHVTDHRQAKVMEEIKELAGSGKVLKVIGDHAGDGEPA